MSRHTITSARPTAAPPEAADLRRRPGTLLLAVLLLGLTAALTLTVRTDVANPRSRVRTTGG